MKPDNPNKLRLAPPVHNPTCVCGKVMFDKKGAQSKRNSLLRMGREKNLRIYQCPQSDGWHLTKQKWFAGDEYNE